ncbi:MAG TPA: hypothetical protein VFA82_01250 [Gaiellaceae bacterium]|nr:hypothetical protein [Gaiellaceae bacterium]
MTEAATVAERYLELGLRLGRHVDGLVDAYYGPAALAERVRAEEPVEAARLADDADALLADLEDGWLSDQVEALAAYARVLAGEPISYVDEVERCYRVRPERTPVAVYEEAHARLAELLPGDGPLADRYLAWRDTQLVDGETALGLLRELLPFLRERTRTLVELPAGECADLEGVRDEPWWAFNYYLGNLRSRVVLNTDVPTSAYETIHLAAHEVYPGHHTEHSLKERRFVLSGLAVEEAIQLVCTPQAVLSEGIAETGAETILDEAAWHEVFALVQRRAPDADLALARDIARVRETLRTVGLDAALLVNEDGAPVEDAISFVARWALRTRDQAAQNVSFVTDPTWRAYAITYSAGRDLCRAYVAGDPARFARLLTEHVRIGELLAAA